MFHLGVIGRVDPKTTGIDGVEPILGCFSEHLEIERRAHHLVEEIVALQAGIGEPGAQVASWQRRLLELVELVTGDVANVEQAQEADLATPLGNLDVVETVEDGGLADQASQQCSLAIVEILGILAVIGLRGRLDAIGTVTEIDLVQIELEQLFFGEFFFNALSQHRLANLSVQRALTANDPELDDLLGDGGAARATSARRHIRQHGPHGAPEVPADVFEEVLVLHCGDCVDDRFGNLLIGHNLAIDRSVEHTHLGVLAVVDLGALGARFEVELDLKTGLGDRGQC